MDSVRHNILFLCSWYPSDEHPTLGNFIEKHAKAAALFHDITVITAVESYVDRVDVKDNEGIFEIIAYYKKSLPLVNYLAALKKAYNKALEMKGSFDMVHVQVTYPAGLFTYFLKQPYIITEHYTGYLPTSGYKWSFWKERSAKAILDRAKLLLPVSENLGKAIARSFSLTPFHKLSNVVDTGVFYPAKEEKKDQPFTFLHISTLNEETKNISGLLAAFAQLDKKGLDFRLLIGGDGNIDELKEKIKASGLSPGKTETFGMQTSREIAKLMRSSHVFVMASHVENQPCVILEALCSGLPVVSTKVGGIKEEITSKNGLLVKPGDTKAFAEACEEVMLNYTDYKPGKIAQKAAKQYGQEAVGKRLSEVYSTVLNASS